MVKIWKNKIFTLVVSVAFVLTLIISVSTAEAAETNYVTIQLKASDIASQGIYKPLQAALNEAREKSTVGRPYKVIVPTGTYSLDKSLHIYSNTHLYMKGVTLNQKKNVETNMLKVGMTNVDTNVGYYYQNVTVEGGTWNAQGNSNTVIKAAHTKNFTMKDVTVRNAKNAHLMEVAAVDGMNIKDCSFIDQISVVGAHNVFYEAIQLDILTQSHFLGYRSEDLPMKNIVVEGCTFKNTPRGVGSHTATLNNPVQNITIKNCTFSNMKSAAIQGMNWQNVNISNNKIQNAPRGIALYTIREESTFLSSTLEKEGNVESKTSNSYIPPVKNQKIVVRNNEIVCGGKDPYSGYEEVGIYLEGARFTKAHKGEEGDRMPAGDYFMSGVTVEKNKVNTIGHGIRLNNVKNSFVNSNIITHSTLTSSGSSFYGIQLRERSTGNTVNGNKIIKSPSNGIYVYLNSSAKSIVGNTVVSAGKYGIDVEAATVTTMSKNNVTSSKNNGINVFKKGKVTTLSDNTINNAKKHGISVDAATVKYLSKNKVIAAKGAGIYLHNKASVQEIEGNTVTSVGKHGIFVENSTASKITKNKVSKPAVNGIYVYKSGKSNYILNNIITFPRKNGIDVEKATAAVIKGNNIKTPSNHGIVVLNGGKVKAISDNTISSAKGRGISVHSVKSDMKIDGNKISKCKQDLIYLNPAATVYTITLQKNILTGKSVKAGIYATTGKLVIADNTIKTTKDAILLGKNSKATVKKNTYSKNRHNGVSYRGKIYANIGKVSSIKASGKSGRSLTVKWSKAKGANGYIVYRSTKAKSGYKKIATLSGEKKVKYTDKNLKKGKVYYYKVLPIAESTDKKMTVQGAYSKVVSRKF